MNQSESIAKLAEALSKAQGEMSHAHKGSDNPYFKSKYSDLPTIIDAARPHLTVNGLSVIQSTDFDENGMWVVTQLNHNSGEWIRGRYKIKPVKDDPQGIGSAITYARRYAYQAMVGIATSLDDDDGNAASGNLVKSKPETPVKEQKAVYAPTDPLRPHKDDYVVPALINLDGSLNFDEWSTELHNKILQAKTSNELALWNRSNAKTLRAMQTERPDLFVWFGEEYSKKSQSLI